MLYRLPEDILSRLVLPLSDVTKEQVRELSAEANLGAADRKDSQEICFLPDGDYAGYVETVKGRFPKGNFIDTEGRVLGEHNGIIRYTVGQRKGLGLALGERACVTRIDPGSNEITLSTAPMGVSELMLSDVVYSGIKSSEKLSAKHLFAKVRYTAPLVPVTAEVVGEGRVKVKFEIPIKAAPGQSCVLYDGDVIALGGIIE